MPGTTSDPGASLIKEIIMTETTNTPTTQPEATELVAAGEALFKSLTGREMSDNQQKVSDGLTKIVDGLLPSLENMIKRFTLSTVITGLTMSLRGTALLINGARTPNQTKQDAADTTTQTTNP